MNTQEQYQLWRINFVVYSPFQTLIEFHNIVGGLQQGENPHKYLERLKKTQLPFRVDGLNLEVFWADIYVGI
ncbi:hypothetical protein NECAME_04832 [Necator americanus]|uniref:Uncharacterized protein n=1 Tax=Necator americanus TaxID=51031 RepID=W2SLX2_NECAM|nr:hypothetical protein NECAME_04832 [Necator americanus]ETN70674.1 hypothetical protein NECAME_04832 [Necator americanus]